MDRRPPARSSSPTAAAPHRRGAAAPHRRRLRLRTTQGWSASARLATRDARAAAVRRRRSARDGATRLRLRCPTLGCGRRISAASRGASICTTGARLAASSRAPAPASTLSAPCRRRRPRRPPASTLRRRFAGVAGRWARRPSAKAERSRSRRGRDAGGAGEASGVVARRRAACRPPRLSARAPPRARRRPSPLRRPRRPARGGSAGAPLAHAACSGGSTHAGRHGRRDARPLDGAAGRSRGAAARARAPPRSRRAAAVSDASTRRTTRRRRCGWPDARARAIAADRSPRASVTPPHGARRPASARGAAPRSRAPAIARSPCRRGLPTPPHPRAAAPRRRASAHLRSHAALHHGAADRWSARATAHVTRRGATPRAVSCSAPALRSQRSRARWRPRARAARAAPTAVGKPPRSSLRCASATAALQPPRPGAVAMLRDRSRCGAAGCRRRRPPSSSRLGSARQNTHRRIGRPRASTAAVARAVAGGASRCLVRADRATVVRVVASARRARSSRYAR